MHPLTNSSSSKSNNTTSSQQDKDNESSSSKNDHINDQCRAHEHFLTVSRVTRAQAKSERGLRRSTSSGLFSWLFANGDDNEDDDPHGYSSNGGSSIILQDDGTLNLSQRPDLGPVTLEELSSQVKRKSLEMHHSTQSSPAGTRPKTSRFRQDLKALSTAVRCASSVQLSTVAGGTEKMDVPTVELFVGTIVREYDTMNERHGNESSDITTSSSNDGSRGDDINPFTDKAMSRNNQLAFLLHLASHVILSHEAINDNGEEGRSVSADCYTALIERMVTMVCHSELPSYALEVVFTSMFCLLRMTVRREDTSATTFYVLKALQPRSSQQNQTTAPPTPPPQSPTSTSFGNETAVVLGSSPVVADALALYLGIFLQETLSDGRSIIQSTRSWSVVFSTLSLLSKHRSGCLFGYQCLMYLMHSPTMKSKVSLLYVILIHMFFNSLNFS
jgi:hypothetical protein